jgi:hypothetical protein
MQTYTFDELDQRGQLFATNRYKEAIWNNDFKDVPAEVLPQVELDRHKLAHMAFTFANDGWRFNEHGERTA